MEENKTKKNGRKQVWQGINFQNTQTAHTSQKKKQKKKGRIPKETFLQDTYFLVIHPVFHALIFVSPFISSF